MNTGMAITVWPGANAHLLEELTGRHEGNDDLDRHGFRRVFGRVTLFPDLDRGTGGALMGGHGMVRVGLILDQHFLITAMH